MIPAPVIAIALTAILVLLGFSSIFSSEALKARQKGLPLNIPESLEATAVVFAVLALVGLAVLGGLLLATGQLELPY